MVYEGTISRVDFPNKGIVYIPEEDRLVTVKNGMPGQKIRFVINKFKKGNAEGRLLEVLEKSPLETRRPVCSIFPACGGCMYQTMPYEEQIKMKEGQIRRIMDEVVQGDYIFEGVKSSPKEFGYRNKMEFSFGDEVKDGPLALGLHKRGSFHDIVTAAGCRIADEDFSRTVLYPDPAFASVSKKGLTSLFNAGVFGEYTYHAGDKFTAIAGVRGEWYSRDGFKCSLRATLKYSPVEQIVVRLNGGRGLRYSMPLADNIGVLSTGKAFKGMFNDHILEDSWTYGGNVTYYLPFGASDNTYISFDYFHTGFNRQMVVDYEHEANVIDFYALDGRRSFTDNYQVDFSVEPVRRFTLTATFRYTDARIELKDRGLVEKPMTSRYKGVLNLQYATNLSKWIFDFTASLNGPSRVYGFMEGLKGSDGKLLYEDGHTPVYPMLYAQITRRLKGVDIYIGGENLTGFRQKDVIIGAVRGQDGVVNPRQPSFDASAVWGPLMGIRFYAGVRFTLWKKH